MPLFIPFQFVTCQQPGESEKNSFINIKSRIMEQSIFGKTEAGDSSGDTVATTPGDTMDVDVNVCATADTPDTADVDVDVDVDMADKPPNDDDNEESSDRDSLPDLTDIEARHLRKTPNHEVKTTERQGLLYSGFFRQLQLKPQKYLEFYNGVIWPLRYNHIEEIQRGTPAGYRAFTNRLLRGYGYIIWPSNSAPTSEWLIDVEDLDEGDVRLTYVKPTGRNGASTVPENARYVPAYQPHLRGPLLLAKTTTTSTSSLPFALFFFLSLSPFALFAKSSEQILHNLGRFVGAHEERNFHSTHTNHRSQPASTCKTKQQQSKMSSIKFIC